MLGIWIVAAYSVLWNNNNMIDFVYNYGIIHTVADVSLINNLRAKFFRGNINIYLHFVSLLHIDMTQVLRILPQAQVGRTSIVYIIITMAADVLVM